MKRIACCLIILAATCIGIQAQEYAYSLEVSEVHKGAVIKKGDPGTEDNKYGFEGGSVIFYENNYHLFTAERFGDPELVKMRLGHWKSANGTEWKRVGTIFESSGNFTGEDKFASFWAPMPYFNKDENRWNIFYVAYRSKPNDDTGWYLNYEGRIVRAVSKKKGYKGLNGPYKNAGIILEPGPDDGEWEGLQGTDSFYAYQAADDKWYGFYGSAQTQSNRNEKYPKWTVALARAPKVAGPWKKWSEKGHVEFHENFAENPVITKLENGKYVAMLDGGGTAFGYSFSDDGLKWEKARFLPLEGYTDKWWTAMRTPLCLIPQEDGTFKVFFTAYTKSGFSEVGMVTLKLKKEPEKEKLHYWGDIDGFINQQDKVTLDLVKEALSKYPPSKVEPLERKMAMLMLDNVLHEEKAAHRPAVQEFLEDRIALVVSELQRTKVYHGAMIWKGYNHGFIIRTPTVTFGYDLVRAHSARAEGFAIADDLMQQLVDQCDALFISHRHRDHADLWVAESFLDQNKPVVAPPEVWKEEALYEKITHLKREAHLPQLLDIQNGKQQLTVINYPGHQGRDIENNVSLVITPEKMSFVQTGDQSGPKEDWDWIDEVGKRYKVDVLFPNCWTTDMHRVIKGFQPQLVMSGHENEMGHTIDHRESNWLTYTRLKGSTVPFLLLSWGESYYYLPH